MSLFSTPASGKEVTFFYWGDRYCHNLPDSVVRDSTERQVGGAGLLGGMLTELRTRFPNSLTVCAGNEFTGIPSSVVSRGADDLKLLGKLKTDILVPGTAELNYGCERLQDLVGGSGIAALCANLSNDAVKENVFRPYKIFNLDGVSVAVFGLIEPRSLDLVIHDGVVQLNASEPVITALETALACDNKCDIIVAVTNIGWQGDSLLAVGAPDIDLILGAGDTTAFDSVRVVNSIPIMHTGKYGHNLGRITVEVDTVYDKISSCKAELLHVEEGAATPDPEIVRFATDQRADFLSGESGQIATLTSDFVLDKNGSCNLCQWITDALATCERRAKVVLIRNDDVGTGIPKGALTERNMLELFPYDSPLLVVQITGEEIKRIVSRQLKHQTAFLTWSGLKLQPVRDHPDMLEITIQNKPVRDDEMYVMLTTGTLWADAATALNVDPRIRVTFSLPHVNVRSYLTEVAKWQKVLNVKTDDRWKTE